MLNSFLGTPPSGPKPTPRQLATAGSWVLIAIISMVWLNASISHTGRTVWRSQASAADIRYEKIAADALAPIAAQIEAQTSHPSEAGSAPSQEARVAPEAAASPAVAGPRLQMELVKAKLARDLEEQISRASDRRDQGREKVVAQIIHVELALGAVGCALIVFAVWRARDGLVAKLEDAPKDESVRRYVQASRLTALSLLTVIVSGTLGGMLREGIPTLTAGPGGAVLLLLIPTGLLWFAVPYLLIGRLKVSQQKRDLEREVAALKDRAEALAEENSQFI